MARAVPLEAVQMEMQDHPSGELLRTVVIGLTAFLTVVDLFATQAILPSLTRAYRATPAAMGFAVNSSTMGMAVAGLVVSLFGQHINRRLGILISLSVLSIPTALLAVAPDLTAFTTLRIAQGLCMASAFTLTLAYLGEECSAADAGSAFAAYIAGNVASNFIGRLVSAAVADHLGLASNFYLFAGLNLAGAALVYSTVAQSTAITQIAPAARSPFSAWVAHLRNPRLRAAFGIGFCILFAFIGTFTYVNFVLVRPPLSLGPMQLGFVYFVFLPSVATTLLAGRAVHRWGTRLTLWGSLGLAGVGLPLLLLPNIAAVLLGMVLIGVGTFFAQATATGFVSQAATAGRGAASGIYLACYFAGGLVGTAVLGQMFDQIGWSACVGGIGLSLGVAALLALCLKMNPTTNHQDKRMKRGTFVGLLAVALLLLSGREPVRAEALIGRIVVAQGTPQGPYEEPAVMKEKSPEEKMNMRFPQPVKVGDLIGLAVLDDYDLTIGYVRQVVRTPEGKIRLVVTQGGWLGPWFSFGSRLVAVPIEVVVILGRQLAAFDMPRHEFTSAPTWAGNGSPIAPDETIKIAIGRR